MRRFLALSVAVVSAAALLHGGGSAVAAAPAAAFAVHNTRMASWGDHVALGDGRLAHPGVEADQGQDLNGDGDRLDHVVQVWDPVSGQSTNLGLSTGLLHPASGGRLIFPVYEYAQGNTDLNGDGDTNYGDSMHYVWDPATGRTNSLGIGSVYDTVTLSDGRVAMVARESDHGNTDMNGDGDAEDFVVHLWAPDSGLQNLRIAAHVDSLQPLEAGRLAFLALESGQAHRDLNGDGTAGDRVLQVWDPATGAVTNTALASSTSDTIPLEGGAVGLMVPEDNQGRQDRNGDGDILDDVAAMWDPRTNAGTNLRLASEPSITLQASAGAGRMFVAVEEASQGAKDLNGDGDTSDRVVHIWDAGTGAKNLRLAAPRAVPRALGDGSVGFRVHEGDQAGVDLNGDGDAKDSVVHVWHAVLGTTNVGMAGLGDVLTLGDGTLVDQVLEAHQGVDYNHDGDKDDGVMYRWTRAGGVSNLGLASMGSSILGSGRVALSVWERFEGCRDLNGDGDADDELGYLWDPRTDSVVALGYPVNVNQPDSLGPDRISFMVYEAMHQNQDLNGDGDTSDYVVHIATLAGSLPPTGPANPTPPPGAGGHTTGDGLPTGAGPVAPGPTHSGYWLVAGDGSVYGFGAAAHRGNTTPGSVDLEPTPSGKGYWVLNRNGAVHAFGDAAALGDVAVAALAQGEHPASLSASPTGRGYWAFTNRGRVLAFGDAPHLGDMSQTKLNGPVLGSVATPTGKGYYMVASDGGIFTFGDARFQGSTGGTRLNAPVQSLVPDADGKGYWLVASDGGIFAFDAPFRGSMGGTKLNKPVVGMVRYGNGYLMVGADGGIFNFSDQPFSGSLGSNPPSTPIVSVAAFEAA
ncbi:MAG TPA: hypothetical protein VG795_12945 [Acidimicrobiia bacterium]|nr:hypothetical protein [Acidimicrobiia bacterium]